MTMEIQLFIRVTLCIFIFFCVPRILAITVENNFERESFCNVLALPYQVLGWPRTAVQCGIHCAEDEKCAGYDFNFDTECRLYDIGVVHTGTRCGQSESDALQLYMKRCQHDGYLDNQKRCSCVSGYVGDFCERFMHDCSEGADTGFYNDDTFYWIQPTMAPAPFQVFCEMSNDSRATRIQSRFSPSLSFNRTWQEYRDGFYMSYSDFWLGNLKIHWITTGRPHWLVIQLFDHNRTKVIYNENFVMATEEDQFAVNHTDSVSPPGDHYMGLCWNGNSTNFSTYDRDNDLSEDNCAALYGAGFWFGSSDCSECNPNGDPKESSVRLGIPNELFWTPGLGEWSPRGVLMALFAA